MTRIISCGLDVCACVVICYIAAHVHAARRYICGLRIYIYMFTCYIANCTLGERSLIYAAIVSLQDGQRTKSAWLCEFRYTNNNNVRSVL